LKLKDYREVKDMTRQTNIGLLLALIFIVAFSLVLTEFRQPAQDVAKQDIAKIDTDYYQNSTPRVALERPAVRREVRRPVRPVPTRVVVAPAPTAQRTVATNETPAPRAVAPAPVTGTRGITPVAPVTRPDFAGTITEQPRTTPAGQPYRERTVDELESDVTGTASRTATPAQRPMSPADVRDAMAGQTTMQQGTHGRVYTVINGDNLRKISKKVYNSDNKWRKIYNANRGKLRNPNDIQVGMKLVIPEA
jgi:nucleoid-associated protein YgaU